MYKVIQPKLSLVGGGPGDPELITLKAIRALATADVVLYDALVNESLLQYAPESALKVFVGKRAGQHYKKQDEINELIVDHAIRYGHVVRLKGGDPFIFGRGYEELEHAREHGLYVEVVPGISSMGAVPALQKIPLTHRKMSRGFWVVTATSATGKLSEDIPLVARSSATAVILMGMRKLALICDIFIQLGKGETPVAIIQAGSTEKEKIALGTVSNIEAEVLEKGMGAPAVILIGEVASLHPNYAMRIAKQYVA